MVTRTQPVPASELELEEGIEMLIERLAVPNLWLQPDTSKEYVKNLPVWKFRGWDPLVSTHDRNFINKMEDSPEVVEKMMDGEDPDEMSSHGFPVHCRGCASERVKYRHELGPSNRKKNGNNCTHLHQRNVDQTHHSCCACRIESGEVHSAFDRCRMCDGRNVHLHHSQSVQMRMPSSLCVDRQTVSDMGNMKDSLSCSEESSDEASCPPAGTRPTTRCVICLESYKCGDLLCGLPCGHNYHTRCIMVWLRKDTHDDCPVCRWPAYKSKHSLSHPHRE
jgi:E3 ubiquitin-protein ligase RNF103